MTYGSEACLVDIQESDRHWLVVRTKPRQEKIATLHLRQRNVLPYCPLFKQPQWHPRAPKGPVPLFTGYIFVNCDPFNRYNAVNYCPGVMHIVKFDRRIAVVEQDFVDALKLREGLLGAIPCEEEETGIPIGRRVKVMEGPLAGLEGAFQGYLRGGRRANLLMEFLRTKKMIEVDTVSLAMVR